MATNHINKEKKIVPHTRKIVKFRNTVTVISQTNIQIINIFHCTISQVQELVSPASISSYWALLDDVSDGLPFKATIDNKISII